VITSGNAEDTDDVVVNSLDVTTMPAPRSEGSLSDTSDIIIDGVGGFPVVSPASVSITPGSGIYGAGSVFTIYVTFDGAVSVSGTPYIQLNTGESARAYYDESQSTGNTLAFVYTVMLGDGGASLNYAFNTALQLDGGSIVVAGDPRNISADLSLPAVGSAQSLAGLVSISIVTNSEVPMVDVVSISPANGSYQNTSEFVLAGA
jgi:hypothetical protein